MANKIIRTNIDHQEIDHRMHLYELIRASVFAPFASEFQATTWNGYLSALHGLPYTCQYYIGNRDTTRQIYVNYAAVSDCHRES